MIHHLMCLISTIRYSSQVLKIIEIMKWTVIIFTFILTSISAMKMLMSKS